MVSINTDEYRETLDLLQETSNTLYRNGFDMTKDFGSVLTDDNAFELYTQSLAEGLEGKLKDEFLQLSNNVREGISASMLMETAYGFAPQAQLVMPLFRKFWPQLAAREAFTVMPMDKPDIVHMFMVAYAKVGGTEVALPSMMPGISEGTEVGISTPLELSVPTSYDVLASLGLTSAEAHIQRDFVVTHVKYLDDSGTMHTDEIAVEPGDDGDFSFSYECGSETDHVAGHVDYFNGIVTVSSTRSGETNSKVVAISVQMSVSKAEEMDGTQIEFRLSKVRINAIDHFLRANWSIQFEQDVAAFFDLSVQAQLINVFSQQIAMDIDRKLIQEIDVNVTAKHPTAIESFSKTPPSSFAFGPKRWFDNIVIKLNALSSKVYTDTNIGLANVILANPEDLMVLESTENYKLSGDMLGGQYGKEVPRVVAGVFDKKWLVLSTPVVTKGNMYVILKPDNPDAATMVFAPYRPLTIAPWPLGRKPSMSFLSRYGKKVIRPLGLAKLEISA